MLTTETQRSKKDQIQREREGREKIEKRETEEREKRERRETKEREIVRAAARDRRFSSSKHASLPPQSR